MATPVTSSIEFLMPHCKYLFQSSTHHGFHKAQCTKEKQKTESPAAEELKKLTKAVIFSINNRSFVATKKLVAESYKGDIDELPKTDNYSETEEDFRAVAAQNPEYHIDVVDVCPDVDEENGYATGEVIAD
ncbi:hypothetical protein Slin14017_G084820 [Septoria linicola]|nr:hypothetical protein Slin14017_G084820 [Septoria linicola]